MTFDDLKIEFNRLSRDDKRRFMEEVGLDLLQDLMTNPTFTHAMLSRCNEMIGHIPKVVLERMQEAMESDHSEGES
jgi:hypothetical protein